MEILPPSHVIPECRYSSPPAPAAVGRNSYDNYGKIDIISVDICETPTEWHVVEGLATYFVRSLTKNFVERVAQVPDYLPGSRFSEKLFWNPVGEERLLDRLAVLSPRWCYRQNATQEQPTDYRLVMSS